MTRTLRLCIISVILIILLRLEDKTAWGQIGSSVCTYPNHLPVSSFRSRRPDAMVRSSEKEPNDDIMTAQKLPLGFGPNMDEDVDISGKIDQPLDYDYYQIELSQGDVLGISCLNGDTDAPFDPQLELLSADETVILSNDNHDQVGKLFPKTSQLPVGSHVSDSVIVMVVAQTGTYFVRARGVGACRGPYYMQVRLRRPGLLTEVKDSKQIIFLDFNGQKIINGPRTFGTGAQETIELSPVSTFLDDWGLAAADESDVIDAIVGTVRKALDRLGESAFNNPAQVPGRFGVEVRNSRDHADAFGTDPLVSRVVIGGTIKEFGISTIGLSQWVDPGNFSSADSAVVLLDLLSEAPPSLDSIRSLRVADKDAQGQTVVKGFDALDRKKKIAVLGRVVGMIALHEIGHFLGCFHCDNSNDVCCVMDMGGNLNNSAGAGPDRILDLAVDPEPSIAVDRYASEIFPSVQTQSVEAMFVYSLSTGTRTGTERLAELESGRLRLLLAAQHLDSTSAGETPEDWASVFTAWTGGDRPTTAARGTPSFQTIFAMDPNADPPAVNLPATKAIKDPRLQFLLQDVNTNIKHLEKRLAAPEIER